MTLTDEEKKAIRIIAKFFDDCDGDCSVCRLPHPGDRCIASFAACLAKRLR